jgi:PAS domain S-box-containing protein
MGSSSSTDPDTQPDVRKQEVIAELGQRALETDDFDQLFRTATTAVAETLDDEYCGVIEIEGTPDGDELRLRASAGRREGFVENTTVPRDLESVVDDVFNSEEAVVVGDLNDDWSSEAEPLAGCDATSGISAVIGSVEEPWGILETRTTEMREFTRQEVAFVRNVANVLATAIESQRARPDLEEIYGRISDAFFALDESWRFTHLNERAHELINPENRTLIGANVWEEFSAAVGRKFKQEYERAMYEQETISFEEYYPAPLDSWFEVRAYPSETGLSVFFQDITDRKERERERELFRTLLDHTNDTILVVDPENGRFIDANETACHRLGYDRDELLELSAHDIERRFVDIESWRSHVEDVEFEDTVTLEGVHERKDGTTFPVEVNVTHVEFDREYMIAVARDVTERKERERRLRESEQEYRTLAENFPNGIVTLFDVDLRYTLTAGRAFDRLPVSPTDVEGHVVHDVWPEPAADVLESTFRDVLEGETREIEIEYADRDWVVHVVPITDVDGDVFGGMTIAQDITDRKERKRKLEMRERRLSTLMANVPGMVYRCRNDPGWPMEFVSDACEELTGYDPEALETGEISWGADVMVQADREKLWETVHRQTEEGEPFSETYRIRTADGDVRWVRDYGRGAFDEDGDLIDIEGIIADITDRKRLESKLKKRTRQLEQSNERLEQFAYAVSHDLQEPLRMVTSYLQLVESRYRDELDEDGREFIEFAVDGAERMREMIDSLLEYSRVETQGEPFEPIELESVLEDVTEDLQLQIEETGAEVTTDELPRVKGDTSQVRQVFQNLLSNAITYSGDTVPRIHIGAARRDREWVLSVRDNGIGIAPDDQERIFSVFERLHTDEEYDGTGVGLALCERIVERHGGEIWVNSEPGEGSTFSFTLSAASDESG